MEECYCIQRVTQHLHIDRFTLEPCVNNITEAIQTANTQIMGSFTYTRMHMHYAAVPTVQSTETNVTIAIKNKSIKQQK